MSDQIELKAQARDRVGKGAARELRRNNRVPAVIYGDKKEPLCISLDYKDTMMRIQAGGFMTNILTVDVDGTKHKVLPKDYQLEPVRDFLRHVDLLRISKNTAVTVEIPVHFENEETSVGLKRGGVLNVVRHVVEVNCPADSIPEYFTVDLEKWDLGDSINISSIDLPENVVPSITDRDFTIATIAAPAGLKSEEEETDEAPEAPETEVINQKAETVEGEGDE